MESALDPAAPADQRVVTIDFLKLIGALFMTMMNVSMFNLLPYFLELRGATQGFYGAVAGSLGISNVVFMFLLGNLADRWGKRRSVLLYTLPMLLGSLIAIWGQEQSVYWYFLCRILQGMFMGLGFPLMFAWVVALAPPQKKLEALALFGIGGLLANTLGPLLAEIILDLQPPRDRPEAYLAVWITAASLQLVGIGLLAITRNAPTEEASAGQAHLFALMRRPFTRQMMMVTIAFGGVFGIYTSFGKNFVVSIGLNYVSVLFATYSAGAILSRLLVKPLASLTGQTNLIPLGLIGVGLTFLVLSFSSTYLELAIAGLCYGFGHGVLYPALCVRFLDMQGPADVGRATILYQGMFAAGWGLMPYLGGFILQITQFSTLFGLLVCVTAISMVQHQYAEYLYHARRSPA